VPALAFKKHRRKLLLGRYLSATLDLMLAARGPLDRFTP
jgi:hypothetical protein